MGRGIQRPGKALLSQAGCLDKGLCGKDQEKIVKKQPMLEATSRSYKVSSMQVDSIYVRRRSVQREKPPAT